MRATSLSKASYDDNDDVRFVDSLGSLKLSIRAVEKPWGRSIIPAKFELVQRIKVGEIWFEHPEADDLPLLAKLIFTSEKLSVQVHPNDDQARQVGLASGKSECWYIVDAEPSATIGLGLRKAMSRAELRTAALNGSIEQLLDWKPVSSGDFFYVPAGTIHALGAGLTVLEIQQNSDITYRLYDYGRPRQLHLDDGIAVSSVAGYDDSWAHRSGGPVDKVLHDGPHFCLVRASSSDLIPPSLSNRLRWVLPLEGGVESDGKTAMAGECLLLQPGAELLLCESAVALIGAEGSI